MCAMLKWMNAGVNNRHISPWRTSINQSADAAGKRLMNKGHQPRLVLALRGKQVHQHAAEDEEQIDRARVHPHGVGARFGAGIGSSGGGASGAVGGNGVAGGMSSTTQHRNPSAASATGPFSIEEGDKPRDHG